MKIKIIKKKNLIFTFFCLYALAIFSGCSDKKNDSSSESFSESSSYVTSTTEATSETDDTPSEFSMESSMESSSESSSGFSSESSSEKTVLLPPEQLALYTAYQNALKNLFDSSVLPDGKQAKNKPDYFLIQNIDDEETEELILAWTSSSHFGDVFSVYQYDINDNSFHVKWNQSSTIKLFDKGTVLKPVPVNYGLSSTPDFYPYSIYQYKEEKNSYLFQAYVDAWQKSYLSSDYAGNSYPSKIDTENAGMVYSISYCREGDDYVNDYNYSQSMYEDFCNENYGNQISTEQMNEFNLNNIDAIF